MVIEIFWQKIWLSEPAMVCPPPHPPIPFYHSTHFLVDPIRYVTEFQWDHAKYPTKQSLRNLSEIISKVNSSFHICLLLYAFTTGSNTHRERTETS